MTKASTEKSASDSGRDGLRAKPRRAVDDSSRLSTWIRSIWRQRWLSLVTAWTICVTGWTAVALWPSNYMSSAVIYADLHRLVDEDTLIESGLVQSWSDPDPVALLKSVLLSDQGLSDVRVATELDDQYASTLDKDIMIRATAPTLFVASYDHSDPATAHRVLEQLFSSLDERMSAAASEETIELQRDITDLEEKLQIADADLAEFRQVNAEVFAETTDPAIGIAALEQDIADLRQRIESAIIERDEVAQQLAELPLSQQAPNEPVPNELASSEPAPIEPLSESQREELALLRVKLDELRERYADTHPYVSTVLKAIDALEVQADAGEQSTPENNETDTATIDGGDISAQLADLKQLHEEKIAKLSKLNNDLATKQREIDRLQALTDTTSSVEAEQSRLETEKRELEAALAELVSRRDAGQKETGQQQANEPSGQQDAKAEQTSFKLINGPSLPNKPTGPSRLLCLALVLLGGIGIGSSAAVLRNQSKGVFESAWQLKQRFDVGVLGTISEVLSPAEQKQFGQARLAFGLACLGLMGLFSGLAIAELMNVLTPWGDRLRTQLLG